MAGGLLNATFGNAAEVVISVLALSHGLYIVVRTGLVGSILGQLLLVLGTSLLVAGLKHRKLGFSQPLVQVNFILMVLALVAIGLPNITTYFAEEEGGRGLSLLPILLPVMLINHLHSCGSLLPRTTTPKRTYRTVNAFGASR